MLESASEEYTEGEGITRNNNNVANITAKNSGKSLLNLLIRYSCALYSLIIIGVRKPDKTKKMSTPRYP